MKDWFLKLSPQIRALSIESLHIKRHTVLLLHSAGISNIEQLIEWDSKRPAVPIMWLGKLKTAQVRGAVKSLRASCRNDTVDWIRYAQQCGYSILPARGANWSIATFINEFREIASMAVGIRFGKRGRFLLENFLLCAPEARLTLAEAGRKLSLSKEMARAILLAMIDMFRGIADRDSYCDCKFRIRPEFLEPLRKLVAEVDRRDTLTLSRKEWDRILEKFHINPRKIASVERLIFEILGLQEFVFDSTALRPTMSKHRRTKVRLERVLRFVTGLLTVDHPDGLLAAELAEALRRKFGAAAPTVTEIPALMSSITVVEKVDQRYRARTRSLASPGDHYERLLRQAGKPLHYREIAQRARRPGLKGRKFIGPRSSVTFTLGIDPRFVPLARSGFWALATWPDIETRPITTLAADLLRESGGPLHEDDLYGLMSARRELKRASISTLLRLDKRFQMIAPKVWELRRNTAKSKHRRSRKITAA